MIKSLIAMLVATSAIIATSAVANAEPKCKSGQIYSEELGKCVNAPRGS